MNTLLVVMLLGNIMFETHDVYINGHTGRIAVRVYVPTAPRYSDGAPVFVAIQGGMGSNNFMGYNQPMMWFGLAMVTFIMPGGRDFSTGMQSDGVYDSRGMNCIMALYDVLRFAHGDIPDINGNLITDLSEFPIDTSTIGVAGYSNGGNLDVATLDIMGDSLGFVDFLVNWESPTSDQIILTDIGSHDPDTLRDGDHNGFMDDDRNNPYYTLYGDTTCQVTPPFGVQYDSLFPEGERVFIDGNGNGALDTLWADAGYWEDVNDDGILNTGEDYQLDAVFYSGKWFYSKSATRMLRQSLSTWPSELADTSDVDTFWWFREAVMHFDRAAAKLPHLGVILVFSENDHVQSAWDKPHIHQAFNGWSRNGVWVRLNPDCSYAEQISNVPGVVPSDNPANSQPTTWDSIRAWAEPEVLNSTHMAVAAIAELADRSKFNDWSNNLAAVILPPTPLLFNFTIHLEESPMYFDPRILPNYMMAFKNFADTLAAYGGIMAAQVDWVAIEAFERTHPGYLAYIEGLGHEVTPHAHETVYSLREVKILLEEANVIFPLDGNGHFMAPYWTVYMRDVCRIEHASLKKNVYTSQVNQLRINPWRPLIDTFPATWLTPNPLGPVVFTANSGIKGSPALYDTMTLSILHERLRIDTSKVNAKVLFIPSSDHRRLRAFTDSIGPWIRNDGRMLFGRHLVQWAKMHDIYNDFVAWEAAHPGTSPVPDTFTVEQPDTTHYTPPPGWDFFTAWWDSGAGMPLLPNNVVTSLAMDAQGNLWIGTLGGIVRADTFGTMQWITPHNSALPAWFIKTIVPSYDGIWVGTDYAGVVKLDSAGNVVAHWDTTGSVLPSVGIHAILVASDSTVWVGTFHGGIAVYDGTSWTSYDTTNGLPDMDVFAIEEYGGKIYVGTSGGGVAVFNGSGFTPLPVIPSGGLYSHYVHSLESTPWGLAAGTHGAGVFLYDTLSMSWTSIGPVSPGNNADAIKPNGLLFFRDTLWMANYVDGLFAYDGTSWTTFNIPSTGMRTSQVDAFLFDPVKNDLIIGTIRGVKVKRPLPDVEEPVEVQAPSDFKLVVADRTLRLIMPQASPVKISIYDVAGRCVREFSRELTSGVHDFPLDGLVTGKYFVVVRLRDRSVTAKFAAF